MMSGQTYRKQLNKTFNLLRERPQREEEIRDHVLKFKRRIRRGPIEVKGKDKQTAIKLVEDHVEQNPSAVLTMLKDLGITVGGVALGTVVRLLVTRLFGALFK